MLRFTRCPLAATDPNPDVRRKRYRRLMESSESTVGLNIYHGIPPCFMNVARNSGSIEKLESTIGLQINLLRSIYTRLVWESLIIFVGVK